LTHSISIFAEEPSAFENAELNYVLPPEATIHPFAGDALTIWHCWRLVGSPSCVCSSKEPKARSQARPIDVGYRWRWGSDWTATVQSSTVKPTFRVTW
jgi:hypothetical protein